MSEHYGDCAREGGLRFNGATFMADNLPTLFTNRIADLQQSSRDIVESYHTIRASMFAPDITIPSLEAKEMELLGCVERLEAKSQEVETLLGQVDINTAGQLIRTLPMFRDVSEADGRGIILEYCEDVRMKFSWIGPRALAIKRSMATQTVAEVKMRSCLRA
jgi:hypothetical protein